MLRFAVYDNGKPADSVNLQGAYLVGGDNVPVRAEILYQGGQILCKKRATGPAALAILWPALDGGHVIHETTRLPERDKPYILQVELLRGRLLRLAQKREDWGLHDFEGIDEIAEKIDAARDKMLDALTADTDEGAAAAAESGLKLALEASEELTRFHAGIFLNRRRQVGGFPRRVLGCKVDVNSSDDSERARLKEAFEYITIPFTWKILEPREKEVDWSPFDKWVDWATTHRIPIRGCDLVCFNKWSTPDWLYIWEHDFDTIRDLVHEHVTRVIQRYGQYIQVWDVISGIHANSTFSFNFEQLMELTRMSVAITKKLAPRGTAVIDLVTPWGEYYATNQRTIPPMLYAEMVLQSGVPFDAFGLECCFGFPAEGFFVRDMFQISSLLDRFACFGKPVHLTGVQAPSNIACDPNDFWSGVQSPEEAGRWTEPWSEQVQRDWLRNIYDIALSKPFVEAITWRDLTERNNHFLPHGGLLRADGSCKPSFSELTAIRQELTGDMRQTARVCDK